MFFVPPVIEFNIRMHKLTGPLKSETYDVYKKKATYWNPASVGQHKHVLKEIKGM